MYVYVCYNNLMKNMKDYNYHMALRVRIFPSRLQASVMTKNIGAARFVYNRCVAVDRELHAIKRTPVCAGAYHGHTEHLLSQKSVKGIANAAPFLSGKDIDCQAAYNALQDYHAAWKRFRTVRGTGIPTFHKKHAGGSYSTNSHYTKKGVTGAYVMDAKHLVLPKVGRLRFKGDARYIQGMLFRTDRCGTFTVTQEPSGEWYVSIALASDRPFRNVLPKTGSLWGFDANVGDVLVGSDGEKVPNPRFLSASEKKLAKAQRVLSRRYEAAKKRCPAGMKLRDYLETCVNYQEQREKVSALHGRVARQRKDFLHSLTMREVKNHDLIACEDLKVKNLLKNHCLAKAISDVSWGELFRQFSYKCGLYGRIFIQVPPHYTTQTCSVCGSVLPEGERLTLADREWTCPNCGTHHDRDVNAAVMVLHRAEELL